MPTLAKVMGILFKDSFITEQDLIVEYGFYLFNLFQSSLNSTLGSKAGLFESI